MMRPVLLFKTPANIGQDRLVDAGPSFFCSLPDFGHIIVRDAQREVLNVLLASTVASAAAHHTFLFTFPAMA
jgi:hypothetical protein